MDGRIRNTRRLAKAKVRDTMILVKINNLQFVEVNGVRYQVHINASIVNGVVNGRHLENVTLVLANTDTDETIQLVLPGFAVDQEIIRPLALMLSNG